MDAILVFPPGGRMRDAGSGQRSRFSVPAPRCFILTPKAVYVFLYDLPIVCVGANNPPHQVSCSQYMFRGGLFALMSAKQKSPGMSIPRPNHQNLCALALCLRKTGDSHPGWNC